MLTLLEMLPMAIKKGAVIGAVMGVLHEIVMIRKGQKKFHFAAFISTVFVSFCVGGLAYEIGSGAGVEGYKLLLWVVITSANSFVVIGIITNKKLLDAHIKRFTSKIQE